MRAITKRTAPARERRSWTTIDPQVRKRLAGVSRPHACARLLTLYVQCAEHALQKRLKMEKSKDDELDLNAPEDYGEIDRGEGILTAGLFSCSP
jgi:hypothetical protein